MGTLRIRQVDVRVNAAGDDQQPGSIQGFRHISHPLIGETLAYGNNLPAHNRDVSLKDIAGGNQCAVCNEQNGFRIHSGETAQEAFHPIHCLFDLGHSGSV
ncbi:MAG: hypothetical protein Kow0063_20990 [Anaerolineae bacterium]